MSELMPKSKNKINNDIVKQLEILDNFREMIKSGEITDFIIAAISEDQNFVMVNYCEDRFTGVGMLEMGKVQLLTQQS